MNAATKKQPTPASSSIPKRTPLPKFGNAGADKPWGVVDARGWVVSRHDTEGEANDARDDLAAAGTVGGPFGVSAVRRRGVS